jgi:hypothetical protein
MDIVNTAQLVRYVGYGHFAEGKYAMKNILLLFALCATTVFAQTSNHVSLQLGAATVWLGMEKAAVKQQVEARGMNFDESSPNNVIVADLRTKRLFLLMFENSRLVYAERDWLRDDSDALPSVMDALTSLVDQGATTCTITHAPMSSPDVKVNRVLIICGERGIILSYGSTNLGTDRSVMEVIGKHR